MPYSLIKEKVVNCPIEERIMIADIALSSINEINPEVELAWNKVAVKRLAELRSGKVNGVSAARVFSRARSRVA